MNTQDERVREIIAEEAGDWFLAHRAGPLSAADRRAFDAWLTASPMHIEEYLGVALVAQELPAAAEDPEMPLDRILERVRAEEAGSVTNLPVASVPARATRDRRLLGRPWQFAAVAATLLIAAGMFLWRSADHTATQHYATRHGEQRTWRLADDSIIHLNSDTALTVHYSRTDRRVELAKGQAFFEVSHEPSRRFQVIAGPVVVTDIGTQFDVYLAGGSTLVTVLQGQVALAAASSRQSLHVSAGEQARVIGGMLPSNPARVDVSVSTAWLHRQIVFEQEPLAAVAAEFNRYSALPFEIETPALRTLLISGVFATDDPQTFIAFLRTLEGVTVEATPTRIRVLGRATTTPTNPPRTP